MPDVVDNGTAISCRCPRVFSRSDMETDRHSCILNSGPEWIVKGKVIGLILHLHWQKDRAVAQPRHSLHFFDCSLNSFWRNGGDRYTPLLLRAEKFQSPVILYLAHRGLMS